MRAAGSGRASPPATTSAGPRRQNSQEGLQLASYPTGMQSPHGVPATEPKGDSHITSPLKTECNTELSMLLLSEHLLVHLGLSARCYRDLQLSFDKTEAQRCEVTCLRSCSVHTLA